MRGNRLRPREIRQCPHHNRCGENQCACSFEKMPTTLINTHPNSAHIWNFVRRQLEQKRRRLSSQQRLLQNPRDGNSHKNPHTIQREKRKPLQPNPTPNILIGNKSPNKNRIHRQTRRATHQWRDQHRGNTVFGIIDRSRSHHAGNRTGKTRQKRDKRLARQTARR